MTEFVCRLAGIPVGVRALYPETERFCREYLCEEAPVFTVELNEADIAYEQLHSDETARKEGRTPVRWKPEHLEQLALYRKIVEQMLDRDILLFHGSAIAVDGEVYLFTAKSGTGKSTHARLWRQAFGDRAFMVNDDKPLLRFTEGGILVCGTPWDGKHHLSRNIMLPLKALGVITRAAENRIEPLSVWEAYPLLLQQSYHSPEPERMEKVLALLDRLCSGVRVCRICCNMEPEAAQISYQGLREETK